MARFAILEASAGQRMGGGGKAGCGAREGSNILNRQECNSGISIGCRRRARNCFSEGEILRVSWENLPFHCSDSAFDSNSRS
jgi:hypothetical protein